MEECSLIPIPLSYEPRPGVCRLSPRPTVRGPGEWRAEAEVLARWMEEALAGGADEAARAGGADRGRQDRPDSADHPDRARASVVGTSAPAVAAVQILRDESIVGKEAYRLQIAPEGIRLWACDGAGVLRGAASIRELLLSGGPSLRCAVIVDEPRFSWRGFMLDTSRNFFSVDFIEKMIDAAAMHKLNVFHWHLTDDQAWRLALESAPEVAVQGGVRRDVRYQQPTYTGGVYTRADVSRIVGFASERHVMVVPEIESPGHVTALLASHPEFCCRGAQSPDLRFEPEYHFGIFHDILCAGSDEVLAFGDRLADELCSLFPGPIVHMGGDEAPKDRWLACPRCNERMKTEKLLHKDGSPAPEKLQAWFMNRTAGAFARRGRRMAGWDEVVDGGVDESVLVLAWRGFDMGEKAARQGYDVVMCPQTKACYLDHKQQDLPEEPGQLGVCTLEDSYRFDPMPEGLSAEDSRRILGAQGNLWTELIYFGRQAEYMLYPRLCALAEVCWSPKSSRDFGDFVRRMKVHGARLDALDIAWRRI